MKFKTYSINNYLEGLDGDYKDINSITINRFNFLKEIVPVYLEELKYLENLHELTLCNLYIDYKDLDIFRNLNLSKLELINCELVEDFTQLINNLKLDNLILDNSFINLNELSCNLDKLTIINMPFYNSVINIKYLDISRATIDINNLDFTNINNLIISNKQYVSNKEYFDEYKSIINILIRNDIREDLGGIL